MKIREIEVTVKYCNSGTQEIKKLTFLFDQRAEEYELCRVYVVEFGCNLIFSKLDNTLLIND